MSWGETEDNQLLEKANLGVMRDAVASQKTTDTTSTAPVESVSNHQEPSAPLTQVFFSEGELLPWKGRWFRVKLLELHGERLIGLELVKATSKAEKIAAKTQCWKQQHPRHNQNTKNLLSRSTYLRLSSAEQSSAVV